MDDRRHDMWSKGPLDNQRLPRKRGPPQGRPSERCFSVFNTVPRQPPQLGSERPLLKIPPLSGEKEQLLDGPGEGSYNRYYSLAGHQEYDKGRTSAPVQRSVPPQKGDEAGNQWSRYNPSASPQSYNRDERDSCTRQRFFSSKYTKEQSPHTKDTACFGEPLLDQEVSPVSSRRNTPVQGENYSFGQPQQRRQKRKVVISDTSRYISLRNSEPATSSKVLEEKSSRLTEKELCEAVRAWAVQTSEATQESGITELKEDLARPLFRKHPVPPPADAEDSTEVSQDSQLGSSFTSIDSKVKEIEDLYQQHSETFGMMVRKLIEKNPSLERPIQFALSQNLQEIGDRLLKDLKDLIAEYRASQDIGKSS
ncbi:periphilin-1-like [Cavia porcellus]|uniref:periphilin-1-like n=1 Tax=Cavia porcellus TaxID=10141 RepID=UPI002FE23F79